MRTMRVPARVDLDFRGGMAASVDVDRRMLAQELREAVEGEVRFDTATRALYATDASNFRQVPIGVAVPRSVEDIVAIHEVCRRHGAPVLPAGPERASPGRR